MAKSWCANFARGATMPVIMVTAEADRSKLEALVAIGVQGYILKPLQAGGIAQRPCWPCTPA